MRACQPLSDGYVERDGIKIFYEVFGAGEPTILLLPTWSLMHSRQWKMQVPYLARHCRVITFDGRGNGRSDRPVDPEAYAESEFAADAIAVMDATQTERAIIVSFSLGAQRALLLAANYPQRVDAAVFVGPTYTGGGHPRPERTVYSWEDELDTDEGWAKYNKHYWLRDYQGFVDFFLSTMFPEPHSTWTPARHVSSRDASAARSLSCTATATGSPTYPAVSRSLSTPAVNWLCSRAQDTHHTCAIRSRSTCSFGTSSSRRRRRDAGYAESPAPSVRSTSPPRLVSVMRSAMLQ
jgi:pimeloyl-ACP methyl ester carboxylesterase